MMNAAIAGMIYSQKLPEFDPGILAASAPQPRSHYSGRGVADDHSDVDKSMNVSF